MNCDEASMPTEGAEAGPGARCPYPCLLTVRTWLPAALIVLSACAGDQAIERPMPLSGDVPIEYPLELWDRDVEGETLLRVLVTEEGQVRRVEVLQSSGHEALDSAAVGGARELRFQPALRNGRRIEVWATVPVHFSKRRGPAPDSSPPDSSRIGS
jgi:TonB family protein